tara:strand:- start:57 stop:434 length:378 start_codon:yes stop_codon:yes gene_type:complete
MNNKILKLIEERLLVGEKKYGNENVISNGRDFVQEALEESLDLAVYISAKLIEIKEKEKEMGRALDMERKQDEFEMRLKKVEDAVMKIDSMISTTVQHIDLHESTKEVIETPKKAKKAKKEPASA